MYSFVKPIVELLAKTYPRVLLLPPRDKLSVTFPGRICHRVAAAAAAAAKLLQSCPTLCDPIDSSPPGSPVPRILQARTLEWIAISFPNA